MCFKAFMPTGAPFRMQFECTRGGLLDIRLIITDPAGFVVEDRLAFFNKQVTLRLQYCVLVGLSIHV